MTLNHHLTDSELTALSEAAHRQTYDRRKADRLKTIYLLGKGWSVLQVSETLLVNDDTVRNWFKHYYEQGQQGLLNLTMGRSHEYLPADQQALLCLHPEETPHPTSESIQTFLQQRSPAYYKPRGLTGLLNRMGFHFKKTGLASGKVGAEQQKEFLEQLNTIHLYHMDVMDTQHSTQVCYGWIHQGKNYWARSNTGRQRLNINGMFSVRHQRPLIRLEKTVNAQAALRLFDDMQKTQPTDQLHVIADNTHYYHCRVFNECLQQKQCQNQLHFLPAFSSNLNLIERFWGFMKRKVICNRCHEEFIHFKMGVMDFFRSIEQHDAAIRSLMTYNFNPMKT